MSQCSTVIETCVERLDKDFYGQGAEGHAKRFGAAYTSGASDVMIGGAILDQLFIPQDDTESDVEKW